MQRSLVFGLILLFAAIAGALWWLFADSSAPPPPNAGGSVEVEQGADPVRVATQSADGPDGGEMVREALSTLGDPLLDDPDIRAGLCGFRGRVVDHRKAPVPDTGVRIYRGALDSVLQIEGDLFGDTPNFEPQLVAGETQTKDDGRFEITGVWPRGVYLMFAGIGTDAPTHMVLTKTPSPGQIVDLGDVVLNDAGVITGVVYDADGEPMPGALVRAADIPGALARFFPAERFDPEGALLIREPRAPVDVLPMPPWVKRIFDEFPIPTTRSGADGSFRLVGVMPGSNMLAVTAKNYLSHVKDSVRVRAGQEKNVGRIGMRLGEELYAKVLDEEGDPIAGAEVAAGSTLPFIPIDLGQMLGETNAAGEIDGTGFSPGKVTVAARRSSRHAWVVAEPQSINNDVIVTLPSTYSVTVSVEKADGTPAEGAELRLLRGRKGEGAAELYLLGFAPPVDLEGRTERVDDGQWTIKDLHKGTYTVLAVLDGQANGSATFDLADKGASVAIKLEAPDLFTVRVVDQEQQPIRNVAIYAEARGSRVVEMPVNCGRTGEDGVKLIDKVRGERLRVSAEHPRWGVVNGEVERNQEVVLTMIAPGTLRGVLSENGKPPLPGKFTVALMRRRGGGPRGPLEGVPQMVTAGLDGTFEVPNLQPGQYWVGALKSLDALRSPGAIFEIAQSMYIDSNVPDERVEVTSGQTTEVRLEVGDKPLEGPTANLTGSVTVNGRVGSGYTVVARINGNRFAGEVDERGRFDLGVVSAGSGSVSVIGAEDGMFVGPGQGIYSEQLELAENELRELTVDVYTSTISGVAYLPDGRPAAKVFLRAEARLAAEAGREGRANKFGSTNDDGTFSFKDVAEGVWSIRADGGTEDASYEARVEKIEVRSGAPVVGLRIQMQAKLMVRGVVDLSGIEAEARWRYLRFYRVDPTGAGEERRSAGAGVNEDGSFSTDDLKQGRYRIELMMGGGGRDRATYDCGFVNVGAVSVEGLELKPVPK